MQSGKICGGLGLRACKAAQDELRLYTLEEMEQAIRRGSRGRKPAKAVNIDEGEEPPSRAGRSATLKVPRPETRTASPAMRAARTDGLSTHRWREPDSNHRSRSGERSLGCCRREMPDQ